MPTTQQSGSEANPEFIQNNVLPDDIQQENQSVTSAQTGVSAETARVTGYFLLANTILLPTAVIANVPPATLGVAELTLLAMSTALNLANK